MEKEDKNDEMVLIHTTNMYRQTLNIIAYQHPI